jgi:hypothetical protein
VARLIQGLYAREPGQARRILRRRIQATAVEPTELCRGMVRVAAKRIDYGAPPPAGPATGVELIDVSAPVAPPDGAWGLSVPEAAHADPMAFARGLAAAVQPRERRCLSDRRIAAVLVSAEGRILAWAINASALNRTLHAEVNLIQGFCSTEQGARGLPPGAQIYTTLQSCRMCAGMIWSAARAPRSLRVFYDVADPGPWARFTALNHPKLGSRIEFGPGLASF